MCPPLVDMHTCGHDASGHSLPNLEFFQYPSPGLGLFNSTSGQDLGFPDGVFLYFTGYAKVNLIK